MVFRHAPCREHAGVLTDFFAGSGQPPFAPALRLGKQKTGTFCPAHGESDFQEAKDRRDNAIPLPDPPEKPALPASPSPRLKIHEIIIKSVCGHFLLTVIHFGQFLFRTLHGDGAAVLVLILNPFSLFRKDLVPDLFIQ